MQWVHQQISAKVIESLCDSLAIDRELAELLVARGYTDPEQAKAFLYPKLAHLTDPFLMRHLEAGVERLLEAMHQGQRITIVGDYDVDGVTSTSLLVSILQVLGASVGFVLPKRLQEGYGLTAAVAERILRDYAPELLIALDCGTNSVDTVRQLREQGVDVLIIDHHRCKEEGTPDDCILINPHLFDDASQPWVNACTVGLVFKFVHGLLKKLRNLGDARAFAIKLRDYLDLVALGTIADIVPLQHENRLMTRFGLEQMQVTTRPGLRALFQVSGLSQGHAVQPMDVGYRLGPRINASGRLADASLPVQLLLSEDTAFCERAAAQLDAFNKERQTIERSMGKQAERMVQQEQADDPAIVVWNPDWHPGVVGIVAGRLAREFNRVSVVLGAEGALAKGSGRGLPGIDLTRVLAECDGLLASWGGHPMAVGLSLESSQVAAFRARFNRAVADLLAQGSVIEPVLEIAAWLRPDQIGVGLLEHLDRLGPFGEGNPEPVFGIRNVVLKKAPEAFGQGHFRFSLEGHRGLPIAGIAWGKAARIPPCGKPIEMAAKLNWNQWNGQCYPQLALMDWR